MSVPRLLLDPRQPPTPSDLRLAADPLVVELGPDVRRAVVRCADFVQARLAEGQRIYGLSTGFGPLVAHPAADDAATQGMGLLAHLRAGQGEPLPPAVARAMLLVRARTLAAGHSGISLGALEALVAALATPLAPVVPEWGSVGASGDLAPLAHAAGVLCGEGEAFLDGARVPARLALERVGLAPLRLAGRDALALVNGTALTTAAAGLAVLAAREAVGTALALSALLVETLGASAEFAADDLLALTGHDATRATGRALAALLAGATTVPGRPLQEAYSLRCVPQLVGAVEETVRHVERLVHDELGGVSDNPVFFPETGRVVHGGNFFGQQLAFGADALNVAMTQLATLAGRQLDLLMDPARNGGRPLMLSSRPGAQSGLAGVDLAATSLVAAMRRHATPASVQSLPTNGHNQDVVPFGTQAALEALRQSERLALVQASLALGLRQAAHLGPPAPRSHAGAELLAFLSAEVAPVSPDRPLADEVSRLATRLPRWLARRATAS